MKKISNQKFFERSALKVAPDLLGKYLCRQLGNSTAKCLMITETEAYLGKEDKASHARSGRTVRNAPMWGEAGRWYVYFTYGMHWMLNIVTGKKDYPSAVLIRGIEGFNGPAKLTKFLKIGKKFNTREATKKNGLWIEDRGVRIKKNGFKKTRRIGVDYVGSWSKKLFRFVLN